MERPPVRQEEMRTLEALKIKEQWGSQIKILSKLGILEIFPDSKNLGIRGIDGKEYPVPKPEEILKQLELDTNQPLWRWEDGYSKCDTEDKIVYFPKEFGANHGGKTKKELLASDSSNAWRIWLVEDMPNIPREGKGKEVGKRHQLEANKQPKEYLELLQTKSEYKNESGLTPEADIMYALTNLEETNQVTNDYQGKGSISYQVGAYFLSSGDVPDSYFNHGNRQACLYGVNPTSRDSKYGFRPGVRVEE